MLSFIFSLHETLKERNKENKKSFKSYQVIEIHNSLFMCLYSWFDLHQTAWSMSIYWILCVTQRACAVITQSTTHCIFVSEDLLQKTGQSPEDLFIIFYEPVKSLLAVKHWHIVGLSLQLPPASRALVRTQRCQWCWASLQSSPVMSRAHPHPVSPG